MSYSDHPHSLPAATSNPHFTWQQIWSFFMRAPRVRSWLFQKDPPSHSQLVQSLLSSPMLIGYVFTTQHSNLYAFPDIGDLITISCRDGDALLGFHFGFKGICPIMPLLFQVARDPILGNPNVIIRRTARQRAPPPYDDHIMSIELSWFESGALGIFTTFCKADSDPQKPTGNHPFVSFGDHRVFNRETADRLSRTAEILAGRSDSTSDLPIDFEDPPDDYYALTIREPQEQVVVPTAQVETCPKQQVFDVENDFAKSGANANSTTTVHTASQSSKVSYDDSFISGQSQTPSDAIESEKSPDEAVLASHAIDRLPSQSDKSLVASIKNPFVMELWKNFQFKVNSSRRVGSMVTMLSKKFGGRFAPEVPLFGRETSYMFLCTSGISVCGRIQRLCSQLNINFSSPLQDQLLLSENGNNDQQKEGSVAGIGNKSTSEQCTDLINYRDISRLESRKPRPKPESVIVDLPASNHEQLSIAHFSTALSSTPSTQNKGKRSDSFEGAPLRKRPRCTGVFDIVDATKNNEGATCLLPAVDSVSDALGDTPPLPAATGGKPQLSIRLSLPSGGSSQRGGLGLTELLSDANLDANTARNINRVPVQDSHVEEASDSGVPSAHGTKNIPSSNLKPDSEGFLTGLIKSQSDEDTAPKGVAEPSKETNAGKMVWTCDRCGVKIRGKKGNLNRHIANKHEFIRAFACSSPNCGRRFQTRLNLVRHEKAVHRGRPFQCAHCPRSFKAEEDQAAHIRSAHSEPDAQLACEVCGSCFGRRSTLNRHMAKVHKSRETSVAEM